MDATVEVALIAATPAFVAALGALVISWLNRAQLTQTSQRLEEVHLEINSRMTQLLELTRSSSHAEGVKDEKDRNGPDSGI